ncbi:hypothetical protein WG66_001316 [Moniliophthora roreri]|nr:hypothetical protein WG66_001316 [Moniliophthora roreri]
MAFSQKGRVMLRHDPYQYLTSQSLRRDYAYIAVSSRCDDHTVPHLRDTPALKHIHQIVYSNFVTHPFYTFRDVIT